MKFGLTPETTTKLNAIFAKYPEVEQVVIYGLRAEEKSREGSDIDLTLKGENLTFDILSKINHEIDILSTPYLIDISIFHKLNMPTLKEYIERVGKVFYQK